MKILFYRYGSLVEPHMKDSFEKAGLEVSEDTCHMREKDMTDGRIAQDVSKWLQADRFLFVFSINFFPAVSDVCEIYQVPYICWTVDSPFIQLFSPSMQNGCNRIFFFDRMQYETFGRPLGDGHAFHLPLAGNPERFQAVIRKASAAQLHRFKSDISFVGSLYNEKNPYGRLKNVPDFLKGYVDGIERAQMEIYGYHFLESVLTDSILREFMKIIPDIRDEKEPMEVKRYKIAHFLIGYDLAHRERVALLNLLAGQQEVDLYTFSDARLLCGVHVKGSADTLTEMPLIFNQSRINLNITMRPIMTGLSLRIYDIVACGGFLLTNFQEELPELFEIGREVEAFSSKEELLEKADFYLHNEDARRKVAERGYERLRKEHTYSIRVNEMVKKVLGTL